MRKLQQKKKDEKLNIIFFCIKYGALMTSQHQIKNAMWFAVKKKSRKRKSNENEKNEIINIKLVFLIPKWEWDSSTK